LRSKRTVKKRSPNAKIVAKTALPRKPSASESPETLASKQHRGQQEYRSTYTRDNKINAKKPTVNFGRSIQQEEASDLGIREMNPKGVGIRCSWLA
jgi:hypothetical protein